MAQYLGGLFESEPAVRESFELGFAAMNACNWDEAIEYFRKAVMQTKGAGVVALLNLIVSATHPGRSERRSGSKNRPGLGDEFDDLGKSRATVNRLICNDIGTSTAPAS